MMKAKYPYRVLAAFAVWFGLISQYIVAVNSGEYDSLPVTTFNYFGFLTVWSNLFVALAVTVPLMRGTSRLVAFFEAPNTRAAVLLYMSFVGISFHILLAHLYNPDGIAGIANFLMHTLVPILYLLDWLLFSPKGGVSYAAIPFWLIFPILYGIWSVIQGLVLGKFPYPFVDVVELGYSGVALNMLGFAAAYGVGAILIVTLSKLFVRHLTHDS